MRRGRRNVQLGRRIVVEGRRKGDKVRRGYVRQEERRESGGKKERCLGRKVNNYYYYYYYYL